MIIGENLAYFIDIIKYYYALYSKETSGYLIAIFQIIILPIVTGFLFIRAIIFIWNIINIMPLDKKYINTISMIWSLLFCPISYYIFIILMKYDTKSIVNDVLGVTIAFFPILFFSILIFILYIIKKLKNIQVYFWISLAITLEYLFLISLSHGS